MSALYATGRLLWRPAILFALIPLALVSALLVWELPSAAAQAPAYKAATLDSLWRFATFVPATLGLVVSALIREMQHTLFAWTLPALSRKLRIGKAVFGALIAAGIAALSVSFLPLASTVALFGWSWLSFVAGGVAFDPVRSKVESRGIVLIIVALSFSPIPLHQLTGGPGYLIGALAAAGGAALLAGEFGESLRRRRPVTFMPAMSDAPAAARQYWERQNLSEVPWKRSLFQARPGDWILAGAYETFGLRKWGFSTALAVQILITVVYCYFLGNLVMAVVFPWIAVGITGLQISTRFLYPVSRSERATLFFLSSVTETLAVSAAALVAIGLIFTIGTRPGVEPDGGTIGETIGLLGFFVALAPIGQWAKTRGSYVGRASTPASWTLRYFAFQVGFMLAAMTIHFAATKFAPAAAPWIGGTILLATHVIFWLALRHYFATRDLIVAQ
jgi:hypothetical protein